MGYNVEKIFEDCGYLSKVKTKKEYEVNTNKFKADRLEYMRDLMNKDTISEQAKLFCQDVFNTYAKRGKIRGGDMMTLNYFAIYYIFPTIISEAENATEICDELKNAWNKQFNENINYTDYDSLMEGFVTKLFGIPIGKR